MDKISREQRSRNMSRIRSKDTQPELLIRKNLHKRGYRYRLHDRNLPGKPDLVLKRFKTVIFINGCFWHYHGCRYSNLPSTRKNWWKKKLEGNRRRDEMNLEALKNLGWKTLVIWECSFRGSGKKQESVIRKIVNRTETFFHSRRRFLQVLE